MALSTGTRLGPYEILAPLGAGGMGEVYRARDTRIDRTVAIKVLPQGLAASPEARQRFEREARAVSSLNHPHICTLYDVGQQDDVHYLVMEHIEGETLSARLERGPLALEEALPFAIQIADALDRAHRQGLVHRDLKPGNIMITKAGAKLLDFGLAKSVEAVSGPPDMTAAATATSPLTAQGAVVGTFQYMAPEQLEGLPADARSDIFSFGAVLYEIFTGRRAFDGKTQASLAAAILKETPRPMSALQPVTPPALERLVGTCLEKDRDERRQTMHDVLLELRWIAEGGGSVAVPAVGARPAGGSARLAWSVAALAALAAIAAIVAPRLRGAGAQEPGYRVAVPPPEGTVVELREGPMALSPDGTKLVFVARRGDAEPQLWLRELDQDLARPIAGTERAHHPFWSPDSRSIGFFASGKLRRIAVSGGVADTVCEAPSGTGGTWNRDGIILWGGWSQGIQRVAASGGQPEPLTRLDVAAGEFAHRHPWFLPDGRHFLFSVRHGGGGENNVMLGSLDGGEPRLLLEVSSNAVYAEPGYLLYWRDDALRAHPFDPGTLAFTGEPFPLAPSTRFEPDSGAALFTVSETGILAYYKGGSAITKSRLVLRDRQGNETGTVGDPGNFYSPRFSRDGRRVAVDNSGVQNNGDVWVYDLSRSVGMRLTADPADETDPVWSPDGTRLVFSSLKRGQADLYVMRASGTAPEEELEISESTKDPSDWSWDGRYLAYGQDEADSPQRSDLWVLDLESGEPRPFLATPFHENYAQFSPDGRWIAYVSNESGRHETYVRNFPGGDEKWQVSSEGGGTPRWRADGTELYYMTQDGVLMVVPVTSDGDGIQAGAPRQLFRTHVRFAGEDHYDISPDGQTFLINEALGADTADPLSLIINWTAAAPRP